LSFLRLVLGVLVFMQDELQGACRSKRFVRVETVPQTLLRRALGLPRSVVSSHSRTTGILPVVVQRRHGQDARGTG
jgi:hypothetical protein